MSLATLARSSGSSTWLWGALVGVTFGISAALSLELALGGLIVLVALYAFSRTGVKSEVVVALFWVAFCFYETIFATVTVPGFFYPFYAAFGVTVAASLLRSGVRVESSVLWLYGGFLVVVLASFIGFTEPVGFEVVQRVFAYAFGLLVALQFGSWRGLRPVLVATVLTGTTIAGWVIAASVQAGFRYRGDITVDQNVVTFFIGFGAIVALAVAVDLMGRRGALGRLLLLLVPLAAMLYAIMLLASRGITIALVLAVLAIVGRALLLDWRKLGVVLLVLLMAAGTVFLPGGDSLIERFSLADTETGNERLPIWEETLEAFAQGDVYALLAGQGFGSSRAVVQRTFGGLTSTHNAFLQILYEFGIIGLALFIALHAFLIQRAFSLGAGRGLVMFGLMWYLIGANLTLNAPDGFMYWTALGVAMALGLWGRPRSPEQVPAPVPPAAPATAP